MSTRLNEPMRASSMSDIVVSLLLYGCVAGSAEVCAWLLLWVEAVWPAPAGDEVGAVRLKGAAQLAGATGGAVAQGEQVGGDPGEVEGRERAEQMGARDGAEAVGEDKVVDDADPERVGDGESGLPVPGRGA